MMKMEGRNKKPNISYICLLSCLERNIDFQNPTGCHWDGYFISLQYFNMYPVQVQF